MSKLNNIYSATTWHKQMKTPTEQSPKRVLLLRRWNELKTKYPWQNIKQEWDSYAAWYLKKNQKELTCNIATIEWFQKTWLSKKPAPPAKLMSLDEVKSTQKAYSDNQKQACEQLLSDFGMEISPEIKELLNQACGGNEGLTKYTVKDWLNSDGNRPHPKSHPITNQIYQLVLNFKTAL